MLYKLIYCDIIIISVGLGGDFVEITNLYLKTEELFKSFKENKIDLAPFHNIAKEILVYINENDITYGELSNKGEIHHHSVNVAILGGNSPIGVLFSALLFGLMRAGGMVLDRTTKIPVDFVLIIQAAIILFVAAPDIFKSLKGGVKGARSVAK